jgi:hypothetical protein
MAQLQQGFTIGGMGLIGYFRGNNPQDPLWVKSRHSPALG